MKTVSDAASAAYQNTLGILQNEISISSVACLEKQAAISLLETCKLTRRLYESGKFKDTMQMLASIAVQCRDLKFVLPKETALTTLKFMIRDYLHENDTREECLRGRLRKEIMKAQEPL